jgi:flagellar biosynthesis protein FlhB
MSTKPLPPSPKRLRDARRHGDVPRSEPWLAWFVVASGAEICFACFDQAWRALIEIMNISFASIGQPHFIDRLARAAWASTHLLASAVGIVASAATMASLAASCASGSLHFAPTVLLPSLKRLHPLNNLRQVFSAKHWTATAMAIFSALAIGVTGYAAILHRLPWIAAMMGWQSTEHSWRAGIDALHGLIRVLLAVSIVPAIASLFAAKRHYLRSLAMSHRDAREELKQTSGDPLVRARQRSALIETAMAPARGDVAADVPGDSGTGCALIINPDHFAVMLYYDGDERSAPTVIQKGAGEAALRIADAAKTRGIPVFCFRKLARRLYAYAETSATIPSDCFRSVAIIYRLIDEMRALGISEPAPFEIDDVSFDE